MMYKALISFTGLVSMAKGDVREISDISLANDLLKAGYIEEVSADKAEPEEKPKAKAETKKTTTKVTEKKTKSPKGKENAK
jgi:hypothetical protein